MEKTIYRNNYSNMVNNGTVRQLKNKTKIIEV